MGLNFDTFPLKEMRRGRELAWNPHAIDCSRDAADWKDLSDEERHFLLLQVVGFLVGERAVAHDLAPLQQVLRREKGRMDEEMYITQQLFEESTHVEFFQRWLYQVLPGKLGEDIPFPSGPGAPILFVELPAAMNALKTDPSPEAQLRAVCCYHQIIEGVSAETGYQIFYDCLDKDNILPGLREGVRNIQVDESRHIAFGTYLARRILSENPHLSDLFEEEMARLNESNIEGLKMLLHTFGETLPFGLKTADYIDMSRDLLQRRMKAVLEHAAA
jgi:ribonucleoside-diphosphate reductase beta chain